MRAADETCDDSRRAPEQATPATPGVVVVFAAGRPAVATCAIGKGGVEIGREAPIALLADDDRISRRHVRIGRHHDAWYVEDLASRNGTFVDGRPIEGEAAFASPVLVRIGRSLLWTVADITPFADAGRAAGLVHDDGPVLGGVSRRAFGEIAVAARAGETLFVTGESGSGKEIAARAFHEARHGSDGTAPFVAVNCAAIPEGLAERLLFGARKGAYSGAAADADGYAQAAEGGTLFLDEIAELDPLIQAKLLRMLETREVLPLGASRSKRVNFAVCVASHKALRDEVSAGRFREDLYFRIGRPEVRVPPIRERVDEMGWLIARQLRAVDAGLSASALFVEACALREWPGNVREFLGEVRRAANAALRARATVVEPKHLADDAGRPLSIRTQTQRGSGSAAALPSDEHIRRALAANAGNVRGTARSLGIHRNQLRRWLAKRSDV